MQKKVVGMISENGNGYVGQQVGNYCLSRLLGRGGFADVYLGEHIYLKTQAAIKILRMCISDVGIEDVLREARTIARLEHPNIVRLLECDMKDDHLFLVMNYAPQGTLRQRYPRGTRLPLERVCSYVQQMASALQYAHDQKLIHRDVKPENMLVGQNEQILLSDFGLAMIAQTSLSQPTGNMAGTIAYMPPEQLQGRPRFASDQYALGVIVYEWLCGTRPFTGSFVEIASQQVLAPPASLCEQVPGLAPEVERVVFKALAKHPADRFESVAAFGRAFVQALAVPATPLFSSGFAMSESVSELPGTDLRATLLRRTYHTQRERAPGTETIPLPQESAMQSSLSSLELPLLNQSTSRQVRLQVDGPLLAESQASFAQVHTGDASGVQALPQEAIDGILTQKLPETQRPELDEPALSLSRPIIQTEWTTKQAPRFGNEAGRLSIAGGGRRQKNTPIVWLMAILVAMVLGGMVSSLYFFAREGQNGIKPQHPTEQKTPGVTRLPVDNKPAPTEETWPIAVPTSEPTEQLEASDESPTVPGQVVPPSELPLPSSPPIDNTVPTVPPAQSTIVPTTIPTPEPTPEPTPTPSVAPTPTAESTPTASPSVHRSPRSCSIISPCHWVRFGCSHSC